MNWCYKRGTIRWHRKKYCRRCVGGCSCMANNGRCCRQFDYDPDDAVLPNETHVTESSMPHAPLRWADDDDGGLPPLPAAWLNAKRVQICACGGMYIPGVHTSCNRPTQLGSLYCQGCSESHCSCDQRCCTGEDEDAMSLNIAQVPHEAVGTCEAVSISDFAERDCNGMRSETSGTFPLAEHITLWAAGLVAPQLPHSAMDVSHERIIDCRNARCPDCQGERFRVNCTRCGARYCWDCEYIELCSSTCTSFVATPKVMLANIGEDLLATIICMAFSFGIRLTLRRARFKASSTRTTRSSTPARIPTQFSCASCCAKLLQRHQQVRLHQDERADRAVHQGKGRYGACRMG